jgi:hypothetical protein
MWAYECDGSEFSVGRLQWYWNGSESKEGGTIRNIYPLEILLCSTVYSRRYTKLDVNCNCVCQAHDVAETHERRK